MKKYRLKKDTPIIKAGTIFQRVTSKYNEPCELMCAMLTNGDTPLPWRVDDIINFDEWFEEVKEYKRWRSEKGERYWFIRPPLYIDSETELHSSFDDECWESGNYFKTKEEAELYKRKLVANQKLIDTAKKAWFEFNGSEGPDWESSKPSAWRYFIEFDHETHRFTINGYDSLQIAGVVYFPTEESAQAYIDNNPEDMKLLFGVE